MARYSIVWSKCVTKLLPVPTWFSLREPVNLTWPKLSQQKRRPRFFLYHLRTWFQNGWVKVKGDSLHISQLTLCKPYYVWRDRISFCVSQTSKEYSSNFT
jgi:hypothetical protein